MDLLYVLALLACPAGMGAMMWFMMRNGNGANSQSDKGAHEQEITQLRAEVAALRQQANADDARSS